MPALQQCLLLDPLCRPAGVANFTCHYEAGQRPGKCRLGCCRNLQHCAPGSSRLHCKSITWQSDRSLSSLLVFWFARMLVCTTSFTSAASDCANQIAQPTTLPKTFIPAIHTHLLAPAPPPLPCARAQPRPTPSLAQSAGNLRAPEAVPRNCRNVRPKRPRRKIEGIEWG